MNEVHGDREVLKQVQSTIETQLRDLQSSSNFDFMAVTDLRGQTLGVSSSRHGASIPDHHLTSTQAGLIEAGDILYEVHSVPIIVSADEMGVLV